MSHSNSANRVKLDTACSHSFAAYPLDGTVIKSQKSIFFFFFCFISSWKWWRFFLFCCLATPWPLDSLSHWLGECISLQLPGHARVSDLPLRQDFISCPVNHVFLFPSCWKKFCYFASSTYQTVLERMQKQPLWLMSILSIHCIA